MSLVSIHDQIKKFIIRKLKIITSDVLTIYCQSWNEAKEKAKTISVKPGWAVYFIRKDDYVDHVAIVYEQDHVMLNLYDAVLLNSSPSPMGIGIGPLTNEQFDKSGLRIITACEYIELYKEGYYKKIFVGPPPNASKETINKAGLIAKNIADTGLIDGKPAIYSFFFIPLLKKFYVKSFDPKKLKTKIGVITKKLKHTIKTTYCGSLVADIWKKAGVNNLPEVKVIKIKAITSFVLFDWSKKNNSILGGLSWDNNRN
ncbi:MAG: hypothetical protein AAB437_03795 [Patescibacteria group bacterium]